MEEVGGREEGDGHGCREGLVSWRECVSLGLEGSNGF